MENWGQQLLNSPATVIMAHEAASITSNRRDQHRFPSFRPTTSSWIHSESPENHLVKMGRYVFLNMMWILAVVLSCFGPSLGGQGMVHVVSCTLLSCTFPNVIGSFLIVSRWCELCSNCFSLFRLSFFLYGMNESIKHLLQQNVANVQGKTKPFCFICVALRDFYSWLGAPCLSRSSSANAQKNDGIFELKKSTMKLNGPFPIWEIYCAIKQLNKTNEKLFKRSHD